MRFVRLWPVCEERAERSTVRNCPLFVSERGISVDGLGACGVRSSCRLLLLSAGVELCCQESEDKTTACAAWLRFPMLSLTALCVKARDEMKMSTSGSPTPSPWTLTLSDVLRVKL